MVNLPRLYIHIGTHKTGSTAIQHALRENNFSLRKEGFLHLSLPREVYSLVTKKGLDQEIIRRFRSELCRQSRKSQRRMGVRFLISWEGFSGDPSAGYKNTRIVAEHLRSATESFDAYIVVYLRRQDEFIESLYTQLIQQGGSCSFREFIDTHSQASFNWEDLLRCYSDLFGREKIIARRYDKAFLPEEGSLLKDFARSVGIRSGNLVLPAGVTPNRGYSRDALEVARLVNPHLSDDEKRCLRRIFQQASCKQVFEKYSYWNNEERGGFLARYSDSNATVAREYFDESPAALFPCSSIDNESQSYQGLSLETVTVVLARALVAGQRTQSEPIFIRGVNNVERKVLSLLKRFPWLKSKFRDLGRKLRLL